jgi:threonyl-tRNA synthetase
MRGMFWFCDKFSFKDVKKSSRPEEIKELDIKLSGGEFKNTIIIFLCVEKGDKKEFLEKVVERANELNGKYYKTRNIIVFPFVHLSNNIEDPETANEFCEDLVRELKNNKYIVSKTTFGTHKKAVFERSGMEAGVSYFEYP